MRHAPCFSGSQQDSIPPVAASARNTNAKTPRGKTPRKAAPKRRVPADRHAKSDSGVDHPQSTPPPEDSAGKTSEMEVRVRTPSYWYKLELTTQRAWAMMDSDSNNSRAMSSWSGSTNTTSDNRASGQIKKVSLYYYIVGIPLIVLYRHH